ncbi:MAG: hypothetical protein GX171_00900 [Clostridiales bacterium]|jgi:cell division protein FtsL|nr:hypothetical protein [Clostridiales bacterium]
MQQAKQANFRQYVLAGTQLQQRERIAVSNHVSIENPGEDDSRQAFIAKEGQQSGLRVSYKWAALLVAFCVFLCVLMIGGKIALTRSLEGEYAQLSARYQAAQMEQQRLMDIFEEKSDASGICYYAVQSLGMRLAGHQETIGVQAAGLPMTMNYQTLRGSASNGQ